MITEPVESKMWFDSKTIKYLVLTFLGGTLIQLLPMLQAHKIDWWVLGTGAVATIVGIITRMSQPDVQAPKALGALNASNFPLRIDQK